MPAAPDATTVQPIDDGELARLFDAALGSADRIVLAVSGGSDSVAMMHLVARWRATLAPARGGEISVATVDHGLRDGSAAEAAWVAARAAELNFPHQTLTWRGAKPATGIQAAARAARYQLLARHAASFGAASAVIAVAHTCDDQAETLLMRLARGSGVDGLAAMAPSRAVRGVPGVTIVRPLLAIAKARLLATPRLAALREGRDWLDDPSNDLDRFERVRLRRLAPMLAAAGLVADKLALSARRSRRASAALEHATTVLEAIAVDYHAGAFARLDTPTWANAPDEIQLRLLSRVIARMGGRGEPPSMSRTEALIERLGAVAATGEFPVQWSLAGCLVHHAGATIDVFRELGRHGLPEVTLAPGQAAIWDNRFLVRVSPLGQVPLTVRALPAEAWSALRREPHEHARVDDLPRRAVLTLPSAWCGDRLIAVGRADGPLFAARELQPSLHDDTDKAAAT